MSAAGAPKRLFRSAVDFAKLADVVPKFKVAEDAYIKVKAANDRGASNVAAYSDKAPDIDWESYKKLVPGAASIINEYEQKYKSLTVPYPTVPQDILQKISKNESEWKETAKKIKDYETSRQKRLQETLSKFEKAPPVDQMWVQDWCTYFPELTIDQRIRPADEEFPADQQPVEEYRENWANYTWRYGEPGYGDH